MPVRGRDFVIMISVSASMAGEPRVAANQIAEAIIQTANAADRVSLWTVGTPELTKTLSDGFLEPKDQAEHRKLTKLLDD